MKTSTKLAGYLFAAGIMAMSPISAFAAEGSGTNGLTFYDYLSTHADKDTVIDFNQAPATGNETIEVDGMTVPVSDIGGLYMLQRTKDDEKPVYFYRGNVKDNNVILNDMCWLIVRTTETGGTKLLYNGTPTNGQCLGDPDWTVQDTMNAYGSDEPTAWPSTNIGVSQFNASNNSPSDMHYMYGERYEAEETDYLSGMVFGNDVTYANGVYTLQNTVAVTGGDSIAAAANGHHYTCFRLSTICSEVYYAMQQGSAGSLYLNDPIYVLTLTGGDTIEAALKKMQQNTNSSKVKQTIDAWYAQNMTGVTELLEDTPFNGQKAFGSGTLYSKDVDSASAYDEHNYAKEIVDTMFSGITRENNGVLPLIRDFSPNAIVTGEDNGVTTVGADSKDEPRIDYDIQELGFNANPTVGCPNKEDCYTVDSANGNGALTYPVGLLTNSEMIMAGASGSIPSFAKGQYIDDNFMWWGVSPFYFDDDGALAGAFVGYYGLAYGYYANVALGLRPVVSLKSTLGAFAGDGSRENPFAALAEVTENEDETTPTEGETSPINPQTSDIFLPATLVVVALTSAAFVAVKRNISR